MEKERRPQDIEWQRQKVDNRAWNVAHADNVFINGRFREDGVARVSRKTIQNRVRRAK